MNYCQTEQAQEIIDKYHTDQVEEDYLFQSSTVLSTRPRNKYWNR